MAPNTLSSETSLYDWLSDAETHFLSAVQQDRMQSFSELWLDVLDRIRNQKLSHKTLLAANVAASLIETLSHSLIDLHQRNEELQSRTLPEIRHLLLTDSSPQKGSTENTLKESGSLSDSSVSQDLDGLGFYIPRIHKWLLDNIHDPYPSSAARTLMSSQSGVSLKSINTWFTNARRRIGWNRIMKKYFNGNRSEMTDYTQRVLLGGQSGSEIGSDALNRNHIARELLDMKTAVEKVHYGRYEESEFVKNLEGVTPAVQSISEPPSSLSHIEKLSLVTVEFSRTAGSGNVHAITETVQERSSMKRRADADFDYSGDVTSERPSKRRRTPSLNYATESDDTQSSTCSAPSTPPDPQSGNPDTPPSLQPQPPPETRIRSRKRLTSSSDDLGPIYPRSSRARRGLSSVSDSALPLLPLNNYEEESETFANMTYPGMDNDPGHLIPVNGEVPVLSELVETDININELLGPWHDNHNIVSSLKDFYPTAKLDWNTSQQPLGISDNPDFWLSSGGDNLQDFLNNDSLLNGLYDDHLFGLFNSDSLQVGRT